MWLMDIRQLTNAQKGALREQNQTKTQDNPSSDPSCSTLRRRPKLSPGKFLRMMGVTDRELVDIVLPEIRRLHALSPTVSDLGRNPSPNSPMFRYLSSSD